MQVSNRVGDESIDESAAIARIIETFMEAKCQQAGLISPDYQQLWSEIARLTSAGGKRLRSRLVLIGYQAFGGQNTASILPAAAAMELLHQGMLMHDDIIDRDYRRYGVDNIAGSYRKIYNRFLPDQTDRRHYANSTALLAGDLMISESYLLMTRAQVAPEKIIAIQKLLNQTIFEAVGGELLDTEAAFRQGNHASSETIALYKTASYSFSLPLLVGAELAGASTTDQAGLKDFASNLGIAFQLRDDIIGVFGDQAQTGKSSSSDLREGKQTYLVEQFYQLASLKQQAKFNRWFGRRDANQPEIEALRQLLKTSGALQATEQTIKAYETKARQAWSSMATDEAVQAEIDDLIRVATKRQA